MTQVPQTGQGAPPGAEFGASTVTHSGSDRSGDSPASQGSPGSTEPKRPGGSVESKAGGSVESKGAGGSRLGDFAAANTATVPLVPSSSAAEQAAALGSSRVVRSRGPRRARLQIRHINAWSVLKFSCVLSIALFFVWLIVVGVLFGVLDATGVISRINDAVTTINGAGYKPPITSGIVFGGAAIIGVVNIVLFIALMTIGSVVYNLCADLVGGIEITLSER